jgi:hypothetical protein
MHLPVNHVYHLVQVTWRVRITYQPPITHLLLNRNEIMEVVQEQERIHNALAYR